MKIIRNFIKTVRDFIKIIKDYKKGNLVRRLEINEYDITISYYNSAIIRGIGIDPKSYCATNLLSKI